MNTTRRLAAATASILLAATLAACLPNSGTVTSKRSSFNPTTKQWSYFVSVDREEYSVGIGEFNSCDEHDKVVDGQCK